MTKPYVIELAVIADCENDADAERLGKVITDAIIRLRAGGHVPVEQRRNIKRVKSATVAHVDPDFLAETGPQRTARDLRI